MFRDLEAQISEEFASFDATAQWQVAERSFEDGSQEWRIAKRIVGALPYAPGRVCVECGRGLHPTTQGDLCQQCRLESLTCPQCGRPTLLPLCLTCYRAARVPPSPSEVERQRRAAARTVREHRAEVRRREAPKKEALRRVYAGFAHSGPGWQAAKAALTDQLLKELKR